MGIVDETHRRNFKIIRNFSAREENPKISLTSVRFVNSYQSEKMTETEVKSENGSNGTATSVDVENRIIQQVEYYFGDFNLPRDKFLQEQLKNNEEGWIGIDVMLKFQRLKKRKFVAIQKFPCQKRKTTIPKQPRPYIVKDLRKKTLHWTVFLHSLPNVPKVSYMSIVELGRIVKPTLEISKARFL